MAKGNKALFGAMMFLQYAIWGAWSTSLYPYLDRIGFSGPQIGSIFSCLFLGCMIAPFIGGQIVDRWMPTQVFLGIAHLAGAFLMYKAAVQLEFQSMWNWMLLYSLFFAPTLALTNSICFRNLANPAQDFGRVRLWGTIGWIVVGLLITGARTVWHTEAWDKGCDLMMAAAIASALMGVFCFFLPHTPPTKSVGKPFAFLEALSLLKDRNFFVFMFVSFIITTELQFYYIPTAGFLVDLGAAEERIPAILTVAQVAEILVLMFLLHLALKKWGVRTTMVIGMLAWPLRYFLFCIPNLPICVAALTLHGFGYAFFFVASQIYVNMKAKDDVRASAQAMLTFFTLGLGLFLGSKLTGWILSLAFFQMADGKMIWWKFFMVPAGICLAMALVFVLFFKDEIKASEEEIEAL